MSESLIKSLCDNLHIGYEVLQGPTTSLVRYGLILKSHALSTIKVQRMIYVPLTRSYILELDKTWSNMQSLLF